MDAPRARCHKRVHNIYTSLIHTLLPEWGGTVELGSTVLSALLGIADRLPTLVAATQRAKAAAIVDPVLSDAFPDLPSKVLAQTLQDAEAQLANLRSIIERMDVSLLKVDAAVRQARDTVASSGDGVESLATPSAEWPLSVADMLESLHDAQDMLCAEYQHRHGLVLKAHYADAEALASTVAQWAQPSAFNKERATQVTAAVELGPTKPQTRDEAKKADRAV